MRTNYFDDGEETVLGGLAALDAQVVLAGLHDLAGASEHARSGAAELQVELAHALSVVHGVEGSHFEDVDLGNLEHLGHLLHG